MLRVWISCGAATLVLRNCGTRVPLITVVNAVIDVSVHMQLKARTIRESDYSGSAGHPLT